MGREVRKVPANWQHPRYPQDHENPHLRGRYIGLCNGFTKDLTDWVEGYKQWNKGFARSYKPGVEWEPIDPQYRGMRFTEYHGSCPSPDDYMPEWPESECTHLMMYETCSEGTPISPAFATAEELARWLADNKASAFGSMTATYEQWLNMIGAGWAPSGVITSTGIISGVEAIAKTDR